MEIILNINNLEYSYNDNNIIFNNLCMYIEKHSLTAISGPNNSGKTTLIRLLSNNNYNKKETIIIDGKDIIEYTKKEYDNIVESLLFQDKLFKEVKVKDELYIDQIIINEEKTKYIIDNLKLNKLLNKEINKLDSKDLYKLLLAKKLLNTNKILLIDSLDEYFNYEEVNSIIKFLKKYIEKYKITIIITINKLNNSLNVDNLFIINDGRTILYGKPLEVLEKDNILNKAGLEIPFMIDLSVKLKDYNLLNKIELNKERLINKLWK